MLAWWNIYSSLLTRAKQQWWHGHGHGAGGTRNKFHERLPYLRPASRYIIARRRGGLGVEHLYFMLILWSLKKHKTSINRNKRKNKNKSHQVWYSGVNKKVKTYQVPGTRYLILHWHQVRKKERDGFTLPPSGQQVARRRGGLGVEDFVDAPEWLDVGVAIRIDALGFRASACLRDRTF